MQDLLRSITAKAHWIERFAGLPDCPDLPVFAQSGPPTHASAGMPAATP